MEVTQPVQGQDKPDDSLSRLTESLRAGLPGSQMGAGLLSTQMPAGADPFEFFGSPAGQAAVESRQDPQRRSFSADLSDSDPGGTSIVNRRVALMAQDMAAFGGIGREASLRLDSPAEGLRLDYFA